MLKIMNQKALLIRVGVDLKSGGVLGTINKNDEFIGYISLIMMILNGINFIMKW